MNNEYECRYLFEDKPKNKILVKLMTIFKNDSLKVFKETYNKGINEKYSNNDKVKIVCDKWANRFKNEPMPYPKCETSLSLMTDKQFAEMISKPI